MLEITWLGHGTFQFRLESGEVIVMDPWLEQNPAHPKHHKFDRVDTICITHGHFDHIHDAVGLGKRFDAQMVGIFETCHWLSSKGLKRTSPMNKGGSQLAGPVKVTMTHAVHSCGITEDDGQIIYGGEAAGYVLTLPDNRVFYFAGDTNVFSDMALIERLYHPELAFLPIGDLFTMSPKEAAMACSLLKVKKVIPMHFATFPALTGSPGELESLVKDQGVEVRPLEPGKPVTW